MQLVRTLAMAVAAAAMLVVAADPDSPSPSPSPTTPTSALPSTPTTTTPTATTGTPSKATIPAAAINTSVSPPVVVVDPACTVANLSINEEKIIVNGTGMLSFAFPVANSMEIRTSKTTVVTIGTLNSSSIDRLVFSAPKINFTTTFENLSNLTSLTFDSVAFIGGLAELNAPSKLAYLKISNTNLSDASLKTPAPSGKYALNQVDFENTKFTQLPLILYERNYSKLELTNPTKMTFIKSVTELSQDEYFNALNNLAGTAGFLFTSTCSSSTKTSITAATSSHSICYTTTRIGIRRIGEDNLSLNATQSPTPAQNKSKSASTTTLTVAVVGISVVAVILAIVVGRKFFFSTNSSSRSPRLNERTVGLISKDENHATAHNKVSFISSDDALRDLRLDQQDVLVTKSLGASKLWVGDYVGRKVVIKRIESESNDSYVTKAFINQTRHLASLVHPNLVSLIGVTWVQGTDFGVVCEFMEKGTLKAVLMDLDSEFDLQSKLHMCLDVAYALMYLHSREQNMYMRRLSSRKVLVNGAIECKLNLYECHPCTTKIESPEVFGSGEMAWEAPELLTRTGVLDARKINIFSLGVLICEIMTRASPYQSKIDEFGHTIADLDLLQRIRRKERLLPHENRREFTELPSALREIAERCLLYQPLLRPTAEEVVQCLESVKDNSERLGSTTSL